MNSSLLVKQILFIGSRPYQAVKMARAVEPFANISAQELLKNTPRLFGWVRKEDVAGLRSVVKVLDCKY